MNILPVSTHIYLYTVQIYSVRTLPKLLSHTPYSSWFLRAVIRRMTGKVWTVLSEAAERLTGKVTVSGLLSC